MEEFGSKTYYLSFSQNKEVSGGTPGMTNHHVNSGMTPSGMTPGFTPLGAGAMVQQQD